MPLRGGARDDTGRCGVVVVVAVARMRKGSGEERKAVRERVKKGREWGIVPFLFILRDAICAFGILLGKLDSGGDQGRMRLLGTEVDGEVVTCSMLSRRTMGWKLELGNVKRGWVRMRGNRRMKYLKMQSRVTQGPRQSKHSISEQRHSV